MANQTKSKDTSTSNKDSLTKEDPVTKAAKGILGGILGGKKQSTDTSKKQKDTVN